MDGDQYSTDLMKCISALGEVESATSVKVRFSEISTRLCRNTDVELWDCLDLQYDLILIGGLTGRLDQTVHTLSYLHKQRKQRDKIWVVSDDEVAWCLDTVRLPALRSSAVRRKPSDFVALRWGRRASTRSKLTTQRWDRPVEFFRLVWPALKSRRQVWNGMSVRPMSPVVPFGLRSRAATDESSATCSAEDWETSFDTQISTSNHLVPGKDVTIETTGPVWWCCAITET